MTRHTKRHAAAYSVVLLSTLVSLASCGGDDDTPATPTPQPPATEAKPLSLTILHVNDHHSHLDPETISLNLKTAAGAREAISVEYGGFARVTAAIQALASASPNVLKIHAGDAITGDLYFNISNGRADAAMMNTVCFDSFTLGNHEFDNADAGLKTFIDALHAGGCKTPVLSANVRLGATSPLANGPVKASTVVERDGQKIGIVGLTIAGKTKNSSRPDAATTFENEAVAAQAEIDRLRAQGIDKIVVASHVGYTGELALASQLSGVDVIVGGDSHTLLGPTAAMQPLGLTPEGDYPTRVTNKDGKPVCVVQAWQYSYVVGELKVEFDKAGDVVACQGSPHVLVGDTFKRGSATVSEADAAAIRQDIAASGVLRVTAPDPVASATLASYKAEKDALGQKVVASAPANLCLRRVPGTKRDASRSTLGNVCNLDANVIAHGGDVQQLVAQAFLERGKAFFNADISMQNGGGVRVDLPAGDVTVGKIYSVLPFKNTLVQLQMTGAEVKAALEDAIASVVANNTGSYPYTGGLRWDVDLNQPAGSRLSQLEVKTASGYVPLDPAKTYNVATIDFLADGQDGYTTLKSITGTRRTEVGLDYAEAFLTYVESLPGSTKQLNKLPVADYSTQGFVDTP
ncbi:5'-nucleotidase C-terminal domain-containing protein [Cupriavidus respiraculi]|uniref:bifunctional metallophosphatase/5'-nucleotidase n=1 Tax=Cupriavidus respiraculi TaxID=195930 RepID=UPI001C96792C|nr:5'-nucleotidase C-terminal domain-containing protein [Cupriavidus respiraculi]MBY4948162.1 5'-nucleotidase C-terminal domain-containing protein [Cupriavidus respiraculi]